MHIWKETRDQVEAVVEELQSRLDAVDLEASMENYAGYSCVPGIHIIIQIGDLEVWSYENDGEDNLNADFCWEAFKQHARELAATAGLATYRPLDLRNLAKETEA